MSAYTDWTGHMEPVPGTIRFRASQPLTWELGREGSDLVVTVPALYEHDVSIPRPLWWAFDPLTPAYQRAARLHDWLLDDGWRAWDATAVFAGALKADGVSRSRRWMMSTAVLLYIALKQASGAEAVVSW